MWGRVDDAVEKKANIADAFFSSDEEAEKSYHEEVLATQEAKHVAAEQLRCSTFCESLLDDMSHGVTPLPSDARSSLDLFVCMALV